MFPVYRPCRLRRCLFRMVVWSVSVCASCQWFTIPISLTSDCATCVTDGAGAVVVRTVGWCADAVTLLRRKLVTRILSSNAMSLVSDWIFEWSKWRTLNGFNFSGRAVVVGGGGVVSGSMVVVGDGVEVIWSSGNKTAFIESSNCRWFIECSWERESKTNN